MPNPVIHTGKNIELLKEPPPSVIVAQNPISDDCYPTYYKQKKDLDYNSVCLYNNFFDKISLLMVPNFLGQGPLECYPQKKQCSGAILAVIEL